jgi:aryl-alcohol dehydrogenase-like predicted oxidoreductase
MAMAQSQSEIPKRPLGRTGLEVSYLGLGGYHLGTIQEQSMIDFIVSEAMDAGLNFFDNAWEYHEGRSEAVLGQAQRASVTG